MATANLDARLRLRSSEFSSGLKSAISQAKAFGGHIKGVLGVVGVIGGGSLLTGFAKNIFDSALNAEKLKAALATITGSTAIAEMQFKELKKISAETGMNLNSGALATIQLAGAGWDAAKAFETLGNIQKAVFSSGGNNGNFDRAALALQQISGDAYATQQDLSQLTDALPGVGAALNDAFGTARAERLREMGVTSEQLIDTFNKFYGSMKMAGKGAGGALAAAESNWESLKETVGSGFLPGIARVGNAVAGALLKADAAGEKFINKTMPRAISGMLNGKEMTDLVFDLLEKGNKESLEKDLKDYQKRQDDQKLKKKAAKTDAERQLAAERFKETTALATSAISDDDKRLKNLKREISLLEDQGFNEKLIIEAYDKRLDLSDKELDNLKSYVNLQNQALAIIDAQNRKRMQGINQAVAQHLMSPQDKRAQRKENRAVNRAQMREFNREVREKMRQEQKSYRDGGINSWKDNKGFFDPKETRKRIQRETAKEWQDALKTTEGELKELNKKLDRLSKA